MKLQVKSSGMYLNIFQSSNDTGALACQGNIPSTDNYDWELELPTSDGYFKLKVKSSGQYLNILSSSKDNGANACQGNTSATDNYLWKKIPADDGYFYLQVKSSGQYLNIAGSSQNNGAVACQGINNQSDNFLWRETYSIGDYAKGGIIASVDLDGTSGLVYDDGLLSPMPASWQKATDTISSLNQYPDSYSNWKLPSMDDIINVYYNLYQKGLTTYIKEGIWQWSTTPGNNGGGNRTVYQVGIFTKKQLLENMQGDPTSKQHWFRVREF